MSLSVGMPTSPAMTAARTAAMTMANQGSKPSLGGEDGRAVGPDAHERRLPQRDLPGLPQQQAEPQGHHEAGGP